MKAVVHVGERFKLSEEKDLCRIFAECMHLGNQVFMFQSECFATIDYGFRYLEESGYKDEFLKYGVSVEKHFIDDEPEVYCLDLKKGDCTSRVFLKLMVKLNSERWKLYPEWNNERIDKLLQNKDEDNVKVVHLCVTDEPFNDVSKYIPSFDSIDELHIHMMSDNVISDKFILVNNWLDQADEVEYDYKNYLKDKTNYKLPFRKEKIGNLSVCMQCRENSKYWKKTFLKWEKLFCFQTIGCAHGFMLRLPDGELLTFFNGKCDYCFEHDFTNMNNKDFDEKAIEKKINKYVRLKECW